MCMINRQPESEIPDTSRLFPDHRQSGSYRVSRNWKIRCALSTKHHDPGPKPPLWGFPMLTSHHLDFQSWWHARHPSPKSALPCGFSPSQARKIRDPHLRKNPRPHLDSTVYSDSTVANHTTYYYAATTVDISGHESNQTAAVKAVVP
jgi:hypothetical protein